MNLQSIFQMVMNGRFRVVHQTPGRLRLAVPELAMVPDEFEEYLATARELLEKLPGVKTVSVNRVTRSVLFHYNEAAVSESELLGWMERLTEDGLQQFGELAAVANIHTRLLKLQAHMNAAIDRIRNHHAATQKN